jgi:putative transposase
MDFVADNLFDGRKLRMVTVVDGFTIESLGIHVDQTLKGEDVVHVFNMIVKRARKASDYKC